MQINILDSLVDNFYVKIDPSIRKALFKTDLSLRDLGRHLNINVKNIDRYRSGSRNIPINIFKRLSKFQKLDSAIFQNKILIATVNGKNWLRIGPLLEIDEEWVYIAEFLKGDGHITRNYWYMIFINKELHLIEYFIDFFRRIGVRSESIYLQKRDNVYFLNVRCSHLAYLFSEIFEIPTGRKNELGIPNFIKRDRDLSCAAVRGAFDAEGSVRTTGSRHISICSISKKWILDLQEILFNLKIMSYIYEDKSARKIPIYRLRIYHQINIKRFYELIKPLHPKRIERLEQVLSDYNSIPIIGELHIPVMNSIKNGLVKRRSIASELDINMRRIGNVLGVLSKRGLIYPCKKVWTNNGGYYEYNLTEKGKKYLKSGFQGSFSD